MQQEGMHSTRANSVHDWASFAPSSVFENFVPHAGEPRNILFMLLQAAASAKNLIAQVDDRTR